MTEIQIVPEYQVNNWRIRLDFPTPDSKQMQWMAEISTWPDGYISPDCAYKCRYCGACLGCIRKGLFVDVGEPMLIDYASTLCDVSPTGFHEVKTD